MSALSAQERTSFENFDLTIYLGPDRRMWLSAHSTAGFVHAVPRRDEGIPELSSLLDLCFDYADGIAFAEREPMPEMANVLGHVVFGDRMVLQLFHATRGVAADRGRRLLVRVLVTPHLSALPWELLPDPASPLGLPGQRYLALSPDVQIVRVARGRAYSSRPRLVEPPLNVLLVLSSPVFTDDNEGFYEFDVFGVKRALLDELAPLQSKGLLRIDVEDRPTIEGLRRRIASRQGGYQVFHFVGHALPDRVYLEDSVGEASAVDAERIVELLRLCPNLQLAVFAGCETARARESALDVRATDALAWRDLLSLADRCVQGACPNVLGMQAVLPLSTERIFTRYLYQGLVTGYSLADAVRIARGAVRDDDRLGQDVLDWSVPALFVGGTDPGPMLPTSDGNLVLEMRQRATVLKLGVRQSSRRFLGRDLALRQAIEILSGRAQERLLVVTGPAGTGKTTLVERALEELVNELDLVLFLNASNLAPKVRDALIDLEDGGLDLAKLSGLKKDDLIKCLCERVNELRERSGTPPDKLTPHQGREANEWWERIVADLAQSKFVVVLDDMGLVNELQGGLLRAAAALWLAGWVAQRKKGRFRLDDLESDLERLLGRLSDHLEGVSKQEPYLRRGIEDFGRSLPGLSELLLEQLPEALAATVSEVLSAKAGGSIEHHLRHSARALVKDADLAQIAACLVKLEEVREQTSRAMETFLGAGTGMRAVVTAFTKPREAQALPSGDVFEIRLASLTWGDTWRWVRRGLPGLARFGEQLLKRQWSRLASRTELWEELERRVVRADPGGMSLDAIVEDLVPTRPARAKDASVLLRARRSDRPLRIAVAGPHLKSPSAFASALTQLAIKHGVAGRVLSESGVPDGVLATVLDESIRWDSRGLARARDVSTWLDRISLARPDVVLLDYGMEIDEREIREHARNDCDLGRLRQLASRSLLVGAASDLGRDSGTVCVPGAYWQVFSVGSSTADGEPLVSSSWSSALKKPNLFMADDLSEGPLSLAVVPPRLGEARRGSSFAALHAVAAAVLAWSMLPELSPHGIRRLLLEASRPMNGFADGLFLDLARAIRFARERLVQKALASGPSTLSTISAITGLEPTILAATLQLMRKAGKVEVMRSGRFERLRLAE